MTEQIEEYKIIADANIEEKDWITFHRFSMHRGKHNTLITRFFMIFWILVGPSLLIYDVYYFGFKYGPYLYLMDIFDWFMALFPLFFAILYFYTRNTSGKRSYRKSKSTKGLKYHFEFGLTEFIASYVNDDSSGTNTAKYSILFKVYETKDYLYLYINRRSAFILNKASLEPHDVIELRTRLQKVLGKKFIIST